MRENGKSKNQDYHYTRLSAEMLREKMERVKITITIIPLQFNEDKNRK